MKPKVIIFDEPTGRLDELSLNKFMRVKEEGHTIVVITHDMELAALADRVVAMNQGQVSATRFRGGNESFTLR
jgi:putative ABC transport system ATP-binding protein